MKLVSANKDTSELDVQIQAHVSEIDSLGGAPSSPGNANSKDTVVG